MNYNFAEAVKATENRTLSGGIKDATFEGIELGTITSQKSGDTFNTLTLKLNIEGHGEYTQNFFEPQSSERQQMQWGLSASPLDHFLITVREILEALDSKIIEDLDNGDRVLTGTFKQVVNTIKEWTKDLVGTKVQIKLVPQSNGFVSMPSFPARITKSGDLGIATRIIGHNLSLTSKELKTIENAKNAAPTNMASTTNVSSTLDAMAGDLEESKVDDLPF